MTIKEIRKMTGLSQSKFAERFGVPVKTLQHWEEGERTPPPYVLHLLERVVKIDKEIEKELNE